MEDSSKLPINRVDYLDDKIDEIYTSISDVDAHVNTLDETLTKRINEVDSEILPGDICYSFRTSKIGWLLCNGQAVSRTDYKDLFEVIGTTYGGGDGSTTFNIPNCSGKFLQMDTSKTIGTSVEPGLPNITGNFFVGNIQYQSGNEYGGSVNGAFTRTNGSGVQGASWTARGTTYNFNASRSNAIYGKSTTVQPPAIVVNYFIKY